MNDEFKSKIVKLNDNLYYYNGYYLPVNQFDSSVFYSKYAIDELTTLDSVRNKDIIDAGGYVGDTALLFSHIRIRAFMYLRLLPQIWILSVRR